MNQELKYRTIQTKTKSANQELKVLYNLIKTGVFWGDPDVEGVPGVEGFPGGEDVNQQPSQVKRALNI